LLLSAAFALPAPAATPLSARALTKTDHRLAFEVAAAAGPVPVWIQFTDHGEDGPADLARMLAAADANLTPRARARRLRAGVRPLVDERDLPVHPAYLAALERAGLETYGVSRWFNHVAVHADAEALNRVAEWPFVARLSVVERMRRSPLPEPRPLDPGLAPRGSFASTGGQTIAYGATQDLATQIRLPAVHDSGYTGSGVLICVLDAGFNGWNTHDAFADLDVPTGHVRDFVQGDTVVTGGFSHNHGGQVLGLIGAHLPGAYVGTGFGATFALARTEDAASETTAEMTWWTQGAEWADSLGADLIASSLGYSTFDNPGDSYTTSALDGQTTVVSRAAQVAASKGMLVVNSAGNEGANPLWRKVTAPADVDGDSLIAVGAVDLAGLRASFSSLGPTADGRVKPDLMALGQSTPLISATNPSGYTGGDGTSYAAPIVAGLAASLMQARPTWTAVGIVRALRETADRWLAPDTLYGYGVPNGGAALRWPESVAHVPPPTSFPQIALAGPNPFRSDGPPARVQFALHRTASEPAAGRVRVHDALGRLVRPLWSGTLQIGEWVTVSWDGRGDAGARLGAGIYFISLEAAGYTRSVRVAWLP
jgi:hypothetical protein